jgi:hypothetical protein
MWGRVNLHSDDTMSKRSTFFAIDNRNIWELVLQTSFPRESTFGLRDGADAEANRSTRYSPPDEGMSKRREEVEPALSDVFAGRGGKIEKSDSNTTKGQYGLILSSCSVSYLP